MATGSGHVTDKRASGDFETIELNVTKQGDDASSGEAGGCCATILSLFFCCCWKSPASAPTSASTPLKFTAAEPSPAVRSPRIETVSREGSLRVGLLNAQIVGISKLGTTYNVILELFKIEGSIIRTAGGNFVIEIDAGDLPDPNLEAGAFIQFKSINNGDVAIESGANTFIYAAEKPIEEGLFKGGNEETTDALTRIFTASVAKNAGAGDEF